jgi:hypothetical protein
MTSRPPDPPDREPISAEEVGDDFSPRHEAADPLATWIPYKNSHALAAYYCGVFSLIPCLGAILGPIALVLGLLGLRYAAEVPEAKGKVHAWIGVVLGLLTGLGNWLVLLLMLLCLAMAIASGGQPR